MFISSHPSGACAVNGHFIRRATCRNVRISEVRNSTVFIGAVAGTVHISKCKRLTLIVAARRVQIRCLLSVGARRPSSAATARTARSISAPTPIHCCWRAWLVCAWFVTDMYVLAHARPGAAQLALRQAAATHGRGAIGAGAEPMEHASRAGSAWFAAKRLHCCSKACQAPVHRRIR